MSDQEEFNEIIAVKQVRKDLDAVLQRLHAFPERRETSLVITNLQQSIMWAGMILKAINDENPYPNSYNPENTIIEPTADGLKF